MQRSAGSWLAGSGPFRASAAREEGQTAFYLNDFFLEDPVPWKHPSSAFETNAVELASRFLSRGRPQLIWEHPLSFEAQFGAAHSAIGRGAFRKLVPVSFEHGRFEGNADDLVGHILKHMASIPESLHAYGWRFGERGSLGATPEVLFQTDGTKYRTMALAGTRPLDRAHELMTDPKEQEEHRIVVEDIRDALRDAGLVRIGETMVARFPSLAHLLTPIEFEPFSSAFGFDQMVRRLHPTAALGASPRSPEAADWLREADREVGRGTFGAPFGVQREDGSGICVVSIRNVTWNRDSLRIGSGVGVVAASNFDHEVDELALKRAQTKVLLGLEGES